MNFISSATETVCSFLPAKGKEIQDNVLFHNIFQMPASMRRYQLRGVSFENVSAAIFFGITSRTLDKIMPSKEPSS